MSSSERYRSGLRQQMSRPTRKGVRLKALLLLAALQGAVVVAAVGVPLAPPAPARAEQGLVASGLGQICAPSGFLRSGDVGAPLGAIVREGETLYCVSNEFSWTTKQSCVKYLPAEEYIRHKTGRSDAIYSGMSVEASPGNNIILFYCLPRKR